MYTQFYRKSVIETVGDFDPNLGPGTGLPYGCGEDTDYLLRVLKAGFTVLRTPSVMVLHPAVNMRSPGLRDKTRAYARGRMYLLRKHNMPKWFVLANILYPLLCLPVECLHQFLLVVRYRWTMFRARLATWISRG
jgi:GT2 family glycosyltransferase